MNEIEFNLTEEKWIRVLLPDYSIKEVSLRDALLNAHQYLDLAGELPTQNVAVLRLLLAVLHTVFSRVDVNGRPALLDDDEEEAEERWWHLWQLGHFPVQPLEQYLSDHKDDFWLFHPTRPFGQVPSAEKGTEYEASKLIGELSESSNKIRLFQQRAMEGKEALDYAEAARWLLYVNAFDDTALKKSQDYKKRKVSKGEKDQSPGVGWLGKLGLIYAVGSNLFSTLMLNMVFVNEKNETWKENHPVWELKMPCAEERKEISLPDNQAELLTLQSRRIKLNRENNKVDRYFVLGGAFFQKENAVVEQMTVWRTDKKSASESAPDILPRRHNSARQMWRDFSSLFIRKEADQGRIPGVVRWVAHILPEEQSLISFRIASVQYGDKDFFVSDVFTDSLTFHSSLLANSSEQVVNRIEDEINKCEKAAMLVGFLADDLDKAAGGNAEGTAAKAREQFYYRVDDPFRRWLLRISPAIDEMDDLQIQWEKTARQIAMTLAQEMVQEAGITAFSGRYINEKAGKTEIERHYSTPDAYRTFCMNLGKLYTVIKEDRHE